MADEAGVLNWAGGEIKGGACPPVPPPPPDVPEASPDPNDIDLNENKLRVVKWREFIELLH